MKDNLPTDRVPLVTLLLIAAAVLAACLQRGDTLELLLDALYLWMFGPSVEDSMSRPRFLVFCLLGALAAIGVQRALDADAAAWTAGASGAAAAALAGHVLLYPRARIVSLLPVPFLFRLFEVPTWILLGILARAAGGARRLGRLRGAGRRPRRRPGGDPRVRAAPQAAAAAALRRVGGDDVMTTRRVVMAVALAFTAFFAFLTLYDAVENGITFLTIVSLGVLVLFAVGILGALAQGPDE